MFVRVGDHDNSDPNDTDFNNKQTFGVKKIIMHSGYDAKTVNNDVALLKLDRKIDFKYFKGTVAPICLPETVRAYSGEEVKNHKQSFKKNVKVKISFRKGYCGWMGTFGRKWQAA